MNSCFFSNVLRAAAALCLSAPCLASSLLPVTLDQRIETSCAVFRGQVVGVRPFESSPGGPIKTLTVMRTEEVFKGRLPALVRIVHRGGTLGQRGEDNGFAPRFTAGEERLVFLSRRADGTLYASGGQAGALRLPASSKSAKSLRPEFVPGQRLLTQLRDKTISGTMPGEDVTDQAASSDDVPAPPVSGTPRLLSASSSATNLMTGGDGLPARFILPDRGEAIPYLVDADYLPPGITLTQALSAVRTALAAWTNVTSLRYVFAGLQSFGMAAPDLVTNDGVLRIQLHDHYGYIGNTGEVLGEGGRGWVIQSLPAGWTTGGSVKGNDFHLADHGYVVLNHTQAFMQNISNFTEVLCHEIGHSIGLGHSSELQNETNPILSQAIMYYLAHGNGRGAVLGSFDINVVRQAHPQDNTPPYCYSRVMDVVSARDQITAPGVNQVQVRGYDLQPTALTPSITGQTSNNGAFSLVNSNFTFVPNGYFADAPRLDPAANGFYDSLYVRYSDGTNASPFVSLRVISFNQDSSGEGIPDNWRAAYFGSPNPDAGPNRHAADDFDGDGFSNLTEFLLGSDPTDPLSNLRIPSFSPDNIQWEAKPYELYEVQVSTDLKTWRLALNPVRPEARTGAAVLPGKGAPKRFYRVSKIP